jgi:hypothetical protein
MGLRAIRNTTVPTFITLVDTDGKHHETPVGAIVDLVQTTLTDVRQGYKYEGPVGTRVRLIDGQNYLVAGTPQQTRTTIIAQCGGSDE